MGSNARQMARQGDTGRYHFDLRWVALGVPSANPLLSDAISAPQGRQFNHARIQNHKFGHETEN